MLDHAVTGNIKKKNNQHNESIENEPKFDNKFSLSSGTKDPLPVVTVRLRGHKRQREIIVSGLACLWDSRAINTNVVNSVCGLTK